MYHIHHIDRKHICPWRALKLPFSFLTAKYDRISSFFPPARIFVWVYDVIILINAIFIALDEKDSLISYTEWLFLSLYIIEILLKLYTYEPSAYFGRKQFWNW